MSASKNYTFEKLFVLMLIYGCRAEYTTKYNLNNTVDYVPYRSWEGILPVIATKARGSVRPGFELLYSHYTQLKGYNASWSRQYRDMVNSNITDGVEGGGGDYGPNSGGYDAFGHGTLLYRLKQS